jgi:hypothetical protein
MIPERGYEVEGFRTLFDFDARFQDRLQDAVIRPLRMALSEPQSESHDWKTPVRVAL